MRNKEIGDFEYGNLSDVGQVRTENQDYYGRYEGSFGQLIIVCDGMGGYEGGSIASRLAVEAIAEHFMQLGSHYDPRYELEQAYIMGQRKIKEQGQNRPEHQNMGTTAVVLLIRNGEYYFANVGDSRLYLKRNTSLVQVSKDHSLVQDWLDSGVLTEEQAAEHPKRNIITKALGTENFMPDINGPYPICKNDIFMLCTDGLYHYFSTEEMAKILETPPQQACEKMVQIANSKGSDDNLTVQIVKSNIGDRAANPERSKRFRVWLWVLLASLTLMFSSLYYLGQPLLKLWQNYKGTRTGQVKQAERQEVKTPKIKAVEKDSIPNQTQEKDK